MCLPSISLYSEEPKLPAERNLREPRLIALGEIEPSKPWLRGLGRDVVGRVGGRCQLELGMPLECNGRLEGVLRSREMEGRRQFRYW